MITFIIITIIIIIITVNKSLPGEGDQQPGAGAAGGRSAAGRGEQS